MNKVPRLPKLPSRKKFNDLPYYFFVLLAIVASVTISLVFCFAKNGYHVDEVYSYGLANSYYKPFLESHDRNGTSPEYVSNDYYNNYVSVNDDTKFKYDSVVYNQEHDVHPPLFYLILHTISSFSPGKFNKWFGLSINIVCLFITLLMIFLTARQLTSNKFVHVACIILYGLSTGAICTTIYIRMYAMLTALISAYVYLHTKIIVSKQQKTSDLIALAIITFLGFLTQYYFLIFAALVSMLYVSMLVVSRQWQALLKYTLSMAMPMLIILVLYPTAYTTILGINSNIDGFDHAQYAISSANSLKRSIIEFAYFINRQLFSCLLTPIIAIAVIAIALKTVTKLYSITPSDNGIIIKRNVKFPPKKLFVSRQFLTVVMLSIASLLYFIVVAKITYWKADRYLFCLYPTLAIVFTMMASMVLSYLLPKHVAAQRIVIAILLAVILALQYTVYLPKGVYPDTLYFSDKTLNNYMLNHSDTACIYVYKQGNEWSDTILTQWLHQCGGGIYKMRAEDAENYFSNNSIDSNSKYTIFIDEGIDNTAQHAVDKIINIIRNHTNAESAQLIATIDSNNHWSIPTSIQVLELE